MTAEVMTRHNHRKFIPVLREGTWAEAAPSWIVGKLYIDLSDDPYSEEAYRNLRDTLLGIRAGPPPIGGAAADNSGSKEPAREPRRARTSGWEDIKILSVAVDEITTPRLDGTRGSALYDVPLLLSRRPPADWNKLFLHNWQRVLYNMRRNVRIVGDRLIVSNTTIGEVKRYHAARARSAVDETNLGYKDFLDARKREQTQLQAKRDAHREQVEDVARNIRFE